MKSGFVVKFFRNDVENEADNEVEKEQLSRLEAIIDMIKNDKNISRKELAKKLEVSKVTIERDLDKLKMMGRIKRIGPANGGYWEVKK